MYLEGQTYAEIGKALGVSRQRSQQLIRPPTAIRHLVQGRASSKCEGCGIPLRRDGHVHHISSELTADAWNNLDNLRWVCRTCHSFLHSQIQATIRIDVG